MSLQAMMSPICSHAGALHVATHLAISTEHRLTIMQVIINHAQLVVAAACIVFISGGAIAVVFENPDLLVGIGDFEDLVIPSGAWFECTAAENPQCELGGGDTQVTETDWVDGDRQRNRCVHGDCSISTSPTLASSQSRPACTFLFQCECLS